MKEVTMGTFEDEVLKSTKPVLVDFWAPWCGPCKMIAPVLADIAEERQGSLKVVKVNVDEQAALAQRYNIRSIPTMLLFKLGEVREQMVGAASKQALLQKVDKALA